MNYSTCLLAKSFDESLKEIPRFAKLNEHCIDTYEISKVLLKLIGKKLLHNCKLDDEIWLQKLELCLPISALIHDIGKGNSNFYEMLLGQRNSTDQILRHEVISLFLLIDEKFPFRRWLQDNLQIDDLTYFSICYAVGGHHRKFSDKTMPQEIDENIEVYLNNSTIQSILDRLSNDYNIPKITNLNNYTFSLQDAKLQLFDLQTQFLDDENQFKEKQDRLFLGLLKSLLISSDVAASALAVAQNDEEVLLSPEEMFQEVIDRLNVGLLPSDFDSLISAWQENNNITNLVYKDFQQNLSQTNSTLTMVEAGCGGGKTLGAYLWAKNWCEKITAEGEVCKLVFCLPTTGTATEIFKDYALESGIDTQLCHSRSKVDLDYLQASNPDILSNVVKEQIDALGLWATPLVTATVDTVLSLLGNSQKALCSVPAFTQSIFIFDEIHSYDKSLFKNLLVFLDMFRNVPILLMTASLPADRKNELIKVRPDINFISGNKELERIKRYRIGNSNGASIYDLINPYIEDNKKILIIKNQVRTANTLYKDLCKQYGSMVKLYHSRYKYKDRSRLHRSVVDRFKRIDEPIILVSTQVAEMSLDISADLLITDEAAIPALIQRLGRLNRRATQDDPWTVYFNYVNTVDGFSVKPYEAEDVNAAKRWIKELSKIDRGCSQADLVKNGLNSSRQISIPPVDKLFDDVTMIGGIDNNCGIWRTIPNAQIRDTGYTITIVLEDDYNEYKREHRNEPPRDWLKRNEITIVAPPKRFGNIESIVGRIKGRLIIPSSYVTYDFIERNLTGVGAFWKEKV